MKILYQDAKLKVIKQEAKISLFLENETAARITFKIDSHDNRLTALNITLDDLEPELREKAIDCICKILEENFGGKEFIVLDKAFVSLFEKYGFTSNLSAQPATQRIRTTTPTGVLKGIKPLEEEFINKKFNEVFSFKLDTDIAKHANELFVLMENSGFLPEKVEDYRKKGELGLHVMCQDSLPMILTNKDNKVVAFCRISELGGSYGYLADTWIDEKYFGTKQLGTAYIYKHASKVCIDKNINQLLLIAPPRREDEFDTYYDCKRPSVEGVSLVILAKFAGPKSELALTFQEQANVLRYQLKSTEPKAVDIAESLPFVSEKSKETKETVENQSSVQKSYVPTNTFN